MKGFALPCNLTPLKTGLINHLPACPLHIGYIVHHSIEKGGLNINKKLDE